MSNTRNVLNKLGFDLEAEKRAIRAGAYYGLRTDEAVEIARPLFCDEEKRIVRSGAYYNLGPAESVKAAKQAIADQISSQPAATPGLRFPR